MSRSSPVVVKRVRREIAYFNIIWSPLLPVARWDINGAVPSMAGIWELYYLENARVPRILKMGRAWYGGLRNEIRTESDPDLPQNAAHRRLLESGDCYYRYTICEQGQDLTDVYSVLLSHRNVGQPPVTASGRYSDVRIQEPDEMEIHRNRRPHEERTPPPMMGSRVPNMFDVAEEWQKYDAEQQAAAEQQATDSDADPDGGE